MSGNKFVAFCVAVAALALPGVALAQPSMPLGVDVAFTVVSQSGISGHTNPAQLVIQNATDYAAFFPFGPPSTPTIDFATQDVLAIAMGSEPTTGYSIQITRVVKNVGAGVRVEYRTTTPAPGTIQGQIVTTPSSVVVVAKQTGAYTFVQVTAPTPSYDSVELKLDSPFKQSGFKLTVDKGGLCHYVSYGSQAVGPINDQATTAELAAVDAAYAGADVATLPTLVPDPRMMLVPTDKVELDSTIGAQVYKLQASIDYYGGVTARVTPLVNALRAIATRLQGQAPSATFEKVVLHYKGGNIMIHQTITLAKDGSVTVLLESSIGVATRFFTGQATKAELQAALADWKTAAVTTLPATITAPPMPDISSLDVISTIGTTDYTTTLQRAGSYGTFGPRLQPLVDAVQAIGDRIVSGFSQTTIHDKVSKQNGTLFVGTYEIDASSPAALVSLLSARVGRWVTIDAGANRAQTLATVIDLRGTTAVHLNLRAGPSLTAKVQTTLTPGTEMKVLDVSADQLWLQVDTQGFTGWVSRHYVTIGKNHK